ncbi:hypothetical protein [Nocardioides aequoreus]|uniref:hypothetical protein n=1 Tax=Nocardioides aequoreus TaxID=397278 RepID=UPI001FDF53B7|nr:hypothetical protein [Nocardioides aequoreus]
MRGLIHRSQSSDSQTTTSGSPSASDRQKGGTMLVPHAQTLAQARSYVAALADRALTLDASSAYERALLELDRVHGDDCPALDSEDLTDDRNILLAASSAIRELENYGINALSVELILAMLVDAHDLDIG